MLKKPLTRVGYSLTLGLSLALAALWLAGARLPLAGAAGPWYVATTGNDGNDCLSVSLPCLTIAGAVAKASSGDVIFIEAGTYTENVSITGKALTFLGDGAGVTLVDGSSTGRVFESDSDLTIADLTVQNGSAAGGDGGGLYATAALSLTNVDVLSSTSAFYGGGAYATGPATFTGGRFEANAAVQGGGAFISNTLTLSGTAFITNTATEWGGGARAVLAASVTGGAFEANSADSGGGLFAEAAALTGTAFVDNVSNVFGGGAYFSGAATLAGADFQANTSGAGGGAHFDGPAAVTGSTFSTNAAETGGGAYFNAVAALTDTVFTLNQGTAITGTGGGASFANSASVSGGAFITNSAVFAGGGAYFNGSVDLAGTAFAGNATTNNRGGGAYFNGVSSVAGATFTGNQAAADRGAGAYFRGTTALTGTDFVANVALNRGAGAYFFDTAFLTNTRFLTNTAGVHGGGAYFNAGFEMMAATFISNTAQTGNGGGAFEGGSGNGRITNSLFTRNLAGAAGAGLFLGTSGTTDVLHTTLANASTNPGAAIFVEVGSVRVTNTIFANFAGGLVISGGVSALSDYNLFFNAPTNAIMGSHSLTQTNPLFVNPAADNYRLSTNSPAGSAGVDQGVATDLDGTPRGLPPSIGAYERFVYRLWFPMIRR